MSFFNSIGRTMTRSQRGPKRSPTPTSATYSPTTEMPPSPVLPSPRTPPTIPKPLYLSHPFVDAALVKGNFKTIVMLPKYVDIMEWVAMNIFDFYTNLNEFYGVITECCTQQTCPTMSAGPTLSYTWINQDRKQVHLPAPTYIDYVMTWIQNLLNDEGTFLRNQRMLMVWLYLGHDFPQAFPSTVKHIYRQLLRVFAHIYHAHFHQILHLRSEPHFNSLFAHFLSFGREYELLEIKDVKGTSAAPVGVGQLWEAWREMGILEG
ncbi:Mob1/phocein [Gymnopilus junonius]|uniref:Mob1/phocein n=1 Tax=Gymnopilus junonius TaxID=109634 RepID=A0A9P5NCK2_GYMJU|nr:Mob1/phocein [Gymnopilus junonius]